MEAAVAGGCDVSSAGGGKEDLTPIFAVGEEVRWEEVRRKAGERGGVPPPVPCKELREARLRSVGVVERSLPPGEPEPGALRKGSFVDVFELEGVEVPWRSGLAIGGTTGDEGRSAVAAAVDRDMRFMLCRREAPSLFVD